MGKTILKYIVIGCVITIVLGLATVISAGWNIFLLSMAILAVAAFIPLIILAFTSKSVPKPTVYGTSAPGKFTTVNAHEQKEDSRKNTEWAARIAITGCVFLAAFFIFSLWFLSQN